MSKFYAVRVGVTPGIYKTWDECKAQVNSFKGAVYKSFKTELEAEDYMTLPDDKLKELNLSKTAAPVIPEALYNIYVDGSFNKDTNTYGWAFAVYEHGALVFSSKGHGNHAAAATMRNVAGELSATMHAVKYLFDNNIKDYFVIHHDYTGIAEWANGAWKAKEICTQAYVKFMNEYKNDKKMVIKFNHVKGHSGIAGNELVDQLAKEGCGIVI